MLFLVFITVLLLTSCTKGYEAIKLTDASQLPEEVAHELDAIELERGVYYFAETFTDEDAYVVFCGGEAYADGYDVVINELEYEVLVSGGTTDPIFNPIYGFYHINSLKESTDKLYNYGLETNFPITIFQIDGIAGTQAWPQLPKGSDLEFIDWWGASADTISNDSILCEIIQSEDQAPEFFNDIIPRYAATFKNLPSIKNSQDGYGYLILTREDQSPFTVTFENFSTNQNYSGETDIDLALQEHDADQSMLEHGGIPYVLVRFTQHKDNQYIRSCLIFDKDLTWRLVK